MARQKNKITIVVFGLFITTLLFSCRQTVTPSSAPIKDNRFDKLIELSKSFDNSYSFDTALLYSDSAYKFALFEKDKGKMATAYLRKGAVFQNSNNLDSSKVYLLKAIALAESISDSLRLALSLNTLGNTLKEMGDIDEALMQYMRAEQIYAGMSDNCRQTYVMLNIGNIYYKIQDYEKALSLYKKCKSISLKADNKKMYRISSFNIANIYTKLMMYDKAERAYLELVELYKKSKDNATLSLTYANLSTVYTYTDRKELCLETLNKALRLAKESKNTKVEAQTNNLLGVYYVENNNTVEAEKCYLRSIALAKKIGNISYLKSASKNLSLLLEKKSDFEQALLYFKLYAKLSDSIINEKKIQIIYELENKYNKKYNEAEILRLSNENAQHEIQTKDLKIQLIVVASLVLLLLGILFFIRLKNKKNRIIAEQKIQQLEEEQKLLAAQSLIVGQENERKRIAQELHDGIGVLLSTASMHFSNVEESSSDETTSQLLNKANTLLRRAGGEVRRISHDMMPGVLSKFGLKEALEDIFENVEEAGSIDVNCNVELDEERLDENIEIILYRVIQEILNNTLKHAQAKRIRFSMKKEAYQLIITYEDDGVGFEQDKTTTEKSLGLSGIKSRIDFLNGVMKLDSSPEKGIKYDIRIPLN